MSRSSSLPSQFSLPRRLNRNISPLILDIQDYGSAFERGHAQAALPPPAAPVNEGTDAESHSEGTDPKHGPVPASRPGRAGGLLVLLLFAALGALGAMVYLDAMRISALERQVQQLAAKMESAAP